MNASSEQSCHNIPFVIAGAPAAFGSGNKYPTLFISGTFLIAESRSFALVF